MNKGHEPGEADAATKKAALLIAFLSSFQVPFMGSSINVALPTIAREFHMDALLLSWVPMAYLVAGAIFLVPFGKVADIYGRKKIFTFGVIFFTITSLLSAVSTSGLMLVCFRVFQGIGSGMLFGTGVAILMSIYPAHERGRVLGINVAAVYCGNSLGPFLGGLLTQHFGWRSVFLLNIPLGVVIISSILWKLKGEWAEAREERLDFTGSAIYCATIAAIMFGLQLMPSASGALLLGLGIPGLFLFVRWEMRVENPVLDVSLFRQNKVFVFSNLATLINYSATFAIAFLMSLYLQYVKHLSPQSAGLIMVSQPILQTVASPFAGRLSDRVEPQIVASCGMALTVAGLLLLSFLSYTTPLWFIAGTLALHGLGFGLFSSPNTYAVMGSVETRFYGVASGILSTMRLVGNAFSIAIAMFVFAFYIGKVQITPQQYPAFLASVKLIFFVFALLCAGGIFASLARGKMRVGP